MSLTTYQNILWGKDPYMPLPKRLVDAILAKRPRNVELLEISSYQDGFNRLEQGLYSGLIVGFDLLGNKPTLGTKLGLLLTISAQEKGLPILLVSSKHLRFRAEDDLGPADTWPEQNIWFLDTLAARWPELEAFYAHITQG